MSTVSFQKIFCRGLFVLLELTADRGTKWTTTKIWHCQSNGAHGPRYTFLLNGNREAMSTAVAPSLTLNKLYTSALQDKCWFQSQLRNRWDVWSRGLCSHGFSNLNLQGLYENGLTHSYHKSVFILKDSNMLSFRTSICICIPLNYAELRKTWLTRARNIFFFLL